MLFLRIRPLQSAKWEWTKEKHWQMSASIWKKKKILIDWAEEKIYCAEEKHTHTLKVVEHFNGFCISNREREKKNTEMLFVCFVEALSKYRDDSMLGILSVVYWLKFSSLNFVVQLLLLLCVYNNELVHFPFNSIKRTLRIWPASCKRKLLRNKKPRRPNGLPFPLIVISVLRPKRRLFLSGSVIEIEHQEMCTDCEKFYKIRRKQQRYWWMVANLQAIKIPERSLNEDWRMNRHRFWFSSGHPSSPSHFNLIWPIPNKWPTQM